MHLDVQFYCSSSRVDKNGESRITMSVILNGQRKILSLPLKANPEEFKKMLSSKKDNALKDYCYNIKTNLNSYVQEMTRSGEDITLENIILYYERGFVSKYYTLNDLFTEYFTVTEKRLGKDMTEDVFNKYKLAKDLFVEVNNLSLDMPAKDINSYHLINLENELKKREFKTSTIAGYLIKMKTIFKRAFEAGKIPSYPFAQVKVKKGLNNNVEFLTEEELNAIKNKEITNERLSKVRDLILFQAYTALSFIDMAQLEKEDFKYNEIGQIYIRKERQKTKIEFTTVLLNDAIAIAKKYDYKLPVISNQRYNQYMKEIADICGIEKNLHSHMLRHTAAMYLLNHHVNIETIAKVMGHSTTKLTRHYAKLLDQTVFNDLKDTPGIRTTPEIKKISGNYKILKDGSLAEQPDSPLSDKDKKRIKKLFNQN